MVVLVRVHRYVENQSFHRNEEEVMKRCFYFYETKYEHGKKRRERERESRFKAVGQYSRCNVV